VSPKDGPASLKRRRSSDDDEEEDESRVVVQDKSNTFDGYAYASLDPC
jgi:hypothetical protein